jgi:hypothetical protein
MKHLRPESLKSPLRPAFCIEHDAEADRMTITADCALFPVEKLAQVFQAMGSPPDSVLVRFVEDEVRAGPPPVLTFYLDRDFDGWPWDA